LTLETPLHLSQAMSRVAMAAPRLMIWEFKGKFQSVKAEYWTKLLDSRVTSDEDLS